MPNDITFLPSGNGTASNDDVTVYDGELAVVTSGAIAKNLFVDTIVNATFTGAVAQAGSTVQGMTVDGAATVSGVVDNLDVGPGWVTAVGGSIQGAAFIGYGANTIFGFSHSDLSNTTVSGSQNAVIVDSTSSINGSVINSGIQSVGGSEIGTVLNGGRDFSTGNTYAETVNGGAEFIEGTASGGVVANDGNVYVTGLMESYMVAGTANVSVGASAEALTIAGGTVNLAGAYVGTAPIIFDGSGSTLNLIGQTGTVLTAGFDFGDQIVVEGIADPTTATLDGTISLTVGNVTLQFAQGEGMEFNLANQGGNTVITLLQAGTNCFVAGTNILTDEGEKPVERLQAGDNLVTASGAIKRIKLIGTRSYSGPELTADPGKQPVCIMAGALGEQVPAQDLWVSPGHALLLGQRLVQARHLVNNVNVVQPGGADSIYYFHILVEGEHDAIRANGAWAESFYPSGNLHRDFDNAASFSEIFLREGAPRKTYRPLTDSGVWLEKERNRILARAPNPVRGYVEKLVIEATAAPRTSSARKVTIGAWAQNLAISRSGVPVRLDVFVGEKRIGSFLANEWGGDLAQAGIGCGRHRGGGSFAIPKNISAEDITVRARGSRQILALTENAITGVFLVASEKQLQPAA